MYFSIKKNSKSFVPLKESPYKWYSYQSFKSISIEILVRPFYVCVRKHFTSVPTDSEIINYEKLIIDNVNENSPW